MLLRTPPEGKGKCISRRGRRRRTARPRACAGRSRRSGGKLDYGIFDYMLGGTHDEVRMWVGFALLLGGVRGLHRTAAHMYVICARLSPLGWLVGCVLAMHTVQVSTSRWQVYAWLSSEEVIRIPRRRTLTPGPVSSPRNLRGSTGGHLPWCDMATVPDSRRVTKTRAGLCALPGEPV